MPMLRLLALIGSSCGVAAQMQTCAGYECIAPHSLRPTPDLISCGLAGCSAAICCELKLPAKVLSPTSQAVAGSSKLAVTHCTPGTHEFVSDSTSNPEVRKAVEQALFHTTEKRQNCGIGPLPLFFDSESFLSGDHNTHFVHVESKFSSNCLSKTFKLNFHIVPGSANVFTIQINRDLGSGIWKFLSSKPAPCHINTNTVSSPQFVKTDSKFVQDAAEFAAAELTFQQREKKCLPEEAKTSGWQVSKVVHAAARVLTGLEITLNLELKAGSTTKAAILTVLNQCGKFEKKCFYQLRLLKDASVCKPFQAAKTPAVAPSPPVKTGSTCANFKCPATMTLRYQPESLKCDVAGGCTSNLCCLAGAQARRLQDSEDSENIASVLQDDPTEAWEAQRSWLHDDSPEIQKRRLAGSTRSPLARRHIKAGTVPTEYDPTDHDCFKKLTVYDQGECGSCYAAAVSQMIGIRLCLHEKKAVVDKIGRRLEQNEDATETTPLEDSDSDIEVAEEDATETIPREDADLNIEVTEEPSPKSLSQESWEVNEKRLQNISMKAIITSPERRLAGESCTAKFTTCPQPMAVKKGATCKRDAVSGGCTAEECCTAPPAPAKSTTLSELVNVGESIVRLTDATGLVVGMELTITDTGGTDKTTIVKITLTKVEINPPTKYAHSKGATVSAKAKTCATFKCPSGYDPATTNTWFVGAGIPDCCQEKCAAPNIPYQATQGSCKKGGKFVSTLKQGEPCTPQCRVGYMVDTLPTYANKAGTNLECNNGLFVDVAKLATKKLAGAAAFSCVPETVKDSTGKKVKVVVLRSSMTIWVSMGKTVATTLGQVQKEVKSDAAKVEFEKQLKDQLKTGITLGKPDMPKVSVTVTDATRRLAGGRRLSDAKFKVEYTVVVAKTDKKTVIAEVEKLDANTIKTAFTNNVFKASVMPSTPTLDTVLPEKTVTIEANGLGFHLGEAVIWKGSDNDLPKGTVGRVADYEDDGSTERIVVKFLHLKNKAFSFKPAELLKARQYGLQIGEKVHWRGVDKDVPKGSVGTVLEFKDDTTGDNKVTVKFPKGSWNFKAKELKKVFFSTPLRRHALAGHNVLHVQDATFFAAGDKVVVGAQKTKNEEECVIVLADTGGLTLKHALKYQHSPQETVKVADVCVDSTTWEHEGALVGEKMKFTGKMNCEFYAKHDPGCTKYKDVGQRTHCQKACHTCPWHSTKSAGPLSDVQKATGTDAWYNYMPSLDQVAQCSKSAGKPSGCGGGGLHNVWNEWMMNIADTDLWQMGGKCKPYTLKCFASEGVVNPLSTDECELYSDYELWHKPCSCIPEEVRPKKYTCPSVSPTSDCGVKVPNAMFYVKHMGDGLSNKDAVLNIQRHITEFGPVWLSFEVTTKFIDQNWKEDPVYIGGGEVTGGHSALAVGWGTYVVPYWILRNSWTKNWADKGYAKFWRGVNLDKIESSNIGVSMPTADFTDFTAPVCTMHHVETNYKSSGATLDQYMFTPTIRCSEKSAVKLFVSHRLKDRSEMVTGVTGNYYTATVETGKKFMFKPIEMKGKGFGLKDGYVWIKMTATDEKGNVGEVNNFIEIPKVSGLARRLLSNETVNSDLFV